MAKRKYDFKEKTKEWSAKQGKEIPVWQAPTYQASKQKAIQVIEKYPNINEGDFWILQRESKSGKMVYSGLIISHNACLKINDAAEEKDKFKPECVTVDTNGYNGSLVFTYNCPEQGIYEVGEVTPKNCLSDYPYAMALKRCMDRVILKISKIAFEGIYSDSEADEFREPVQETPQQPMAKGAIDYVTQIKKEAKAHGVTIEEICEIAGVEKLEDMPEQQMVNCLDWLKNGK